MCLVRSLHSCTKAARCNAALQQLPTTDSLVLLQSIALQFRSGIQKETTTMATHSVNAPTSRLTVVYASSFFSSSSSSSSLSSSLASSVIDAAAAASSSSFFLLFSTSLKSFHFLANASASALSSVTMTLSKMVPPLTCHKSKPRKPKSSYLYTWSSSSYSGLAIFLASQIPPC